MEIAKSARLRQALALYMSISVQITTLGLEILTFKTSFSLTEEAFKTYVTDKANSIGILGAAFKGKNLLPMRANPFLY